MNDIDDTTTPTPTITENCAICDGDDPRPVPPYQISFATLYEGICLACWEASIQDGVHVAADVPRGVRLAALRRAAWGRA